MISILFIALTIVLYITSNVVVGLKTGKPSYRNMRSKALSATTISIPDVQDIASFTSQLFVQKPANVNVESIIQSMLDFNPAMIQSDDIFSKVWSALELLAAEPATIPIVFAIVFIMAVTGVGYNDDKVGSPYEQNAPKFDPLKADMFYGSRPFFVLRRLLKLAKITGAFNTKLLLDWKFGNLEKYEKERAKEAYALSTQLGPTFIKLGQALSIRTDLISEAYALELRQLQDSVPPFDSTVAKQIICDELGINSLNEKFKSLTDEPIASASIGQVYKGVLLDGTVVAVKVQRPKILNDIALDLYLLKLISPIQTKIANPKADSVDIAIANEFVDEWGKGLVAEVDYRLEARNTKQFLAAMEARGLNAVTAPRVVEELSGPKLMVTEWIEGTRLDVDSSADVPRLCGVAVNAYLTMLLDTGVLHCDPHPGNLLRTTDGRLCILDWGMTLEVPNDIQYGLLEFIAHVNSEDYDALPQDFVNLGATPADKLEKVRDSGITDGMAFALRQLNKGGGPSKMRERIRDEFRDRYGTDLSDEELREKARAEMIDTMEKQLNKEGVSVNGVNNVIEAASKRNREIFRLPTYMLYTTRAFSTLEGIGLSIDENYSILQECYPYLAKRLMTDNSPRSRDALRNMLISTQEGLLSTDKLLEFSDGFSEYTTSTADSNNDRGSELAQEAFTDLLLDPAGNLMQELLVDSVANMTDSIIRGQVETIKESQAGQLLKAALKAPSDFVHTAVPKPLRNSPLTLPLTLPYALSKAGYALVKKDKSDETSIKSANLLWNTVSPRLQESVDGLLSWRGEGLERTSSPSFPSVSPDSIRAGLEVAKHRAPTVGRLTRELTRSLLIRAADRIDARSSEIGKHHNNVKDDNDTGVLAERGLSMVKTTEESSAQTDAETTSNAIAKQLANAGVSIAKTIASSLDASVSTETVDTI